MLVAFPQQYKAAYEDSAEALAKFISQSRTSTVLYSYECDASR